MAVASTIPATSATATPPVHDDRLNRNATSLIASSVLTSVLGFAFWIVAARTMSPADVGTGSAVVAALVLLGNMSTLGLRNALPRFLPSARANTARVIGWSYVASVMTALVVGGVFALGAERWANELTTLRDDPATKFMFVAAVAVWAVFVLQDAVLVGLRTAPWVPIENLAYALAKLGMVVALAGFGSWAIPIAWIVPALVLLVPLNLLVFGRLVPVHARLAPSGDDARAEWRHVGRFAAGDHFADIIRLVGAEGVVLIVLAHLGPEASAPLFFAITIAASLQLVSSNVMSAYVAEAAAHPVRADELLSRAAGRIAILVVPGALLAAAFAPLGLALFGSDFVDSGTPVLRLLLLAAIPGIVVSVAIGQARYRRRVRDVVLLAAAATVAPVAGAAFLVPDHGIVAVGWAQLIGQSILAVVLLTTSLRGLLASLQPAALDAAITFRSRVRRQRRHRAAAMLFDELDTTRGDAPALSPRTLIGTSNDSVVAKIRSDVPRVVKVALSPAASRGLERHAVATEAIRSATAGTTVQRLVPELLEIGTCASQTYVIESACAGRPATGGDEATLGAVAGAVGALHRATARRQRPGDDVCYHAVTAPCAVLLADDRLARYHPTIDALASALTDAIDRHDLIVARTHGDCWLGNALVDDALHPPIVTGLIDWEDSVEVGIPDVDLAHLWLAEYPSGFAAGTLQSFLAHDFGDFVGVCGRTPLNRDLPAALVVTLAWLSHVANGLQRASTFSLGRVWIKRNVTPVLDVLEEVGPDRVIR